MKSFYSIILFFLTISSIYSQSCLPDSIYRDSAFSAYPRPIINGVGKGIDKPACINKAYEFNLTMVVPDTLRYLNNIINLNFVSIKTTGAISNLPKGLEYVCNPPTCIFPKKTMGCVKIIGTPDPSNSPGIYKPTIKLVVGTLFGNIEIDYPGTVLPGEYLLTLLDEQCLIYTNNLEITNDNFYPNPTEGWLNSKEENIVDLKLTDLQGKAISSQNQMMNKRFTLPSDLNNGMYLLHWKLNNKSYIQKIIVNK